MKTDIRKTIQDIGSGIKKVLKTKPALFSLYILSFLFILSIFLPSVWPNEIDRIMWDRISHPPTLERLLIFGTDANGRDLFIRTIVGVRTSLVIALSVVILTSIIGVTLGIISGMMGKSVDAVIMQTVEILMSIPIFLSFLTIKSAFFNGEHSILMMITVLPLLYWVGTARLVRSETNHLMHTDEMRAYRVIGFRKKYIAQKYIIHNIAGIILADLVLAIPSVILMESWLSYLGFSISANIPSLGHLISMGAHEAEYHPWIIAFPSITLVLLVICSSFIGNGIMEYIRSKD